MRARKTVLTAIVCITVLGGIGGQEAHAQPRLNSVEYSVDTTANGYLGVGAVVDMTYPSGGSALIRLSFEARKRASGAGEWLTDSRGEPVTPEADGSSLFIPASANARQIETRLFLPYGTLQGLNIGNNRRLFAYIESFDRERGRIEHDGDGSDAEIDLNGPASSAIRRGVPSTFSSVSSSSSTAVIGRGNSELDAIGSELPSGSASSSASRSSGDVPTAYCKNTSCPEFRKRQVIYMFKIYDADTLPLRVRYYCPTCAADQDYWNIHPDGRLEERNKNGFRGTMPDADVRQRLISDHLERIERAQRGANRSTIR